MATKTTASRAASVVLVGGMLAALLGGWFYLYSHSRAVNSESQNETLNLLRDIKQMDSDWSANVLRSHTDINLNYDALIEPLRPFADSLSRLEGQVAPLGNPALVEAVKDLRKTQVEKAALIDSFKAQNSLFKNSLRYVPTAYKDIQERVRAEREANLSAESSAQRETNKAFEELEKSFAAADKAESEEAAQRRIAQAMAKMRSHVKSSGSSAKAAAAGVANLGSTVSVLVDEAMRYSSLPDKETADALRAGLDNLRETMGSYPSAVREPVSNLMAHVEMLLKLRSKQADLLRQISQVPMAPKIDGLSGMLTQRFSNELATQFQFQRYLLAYSAFALLLVIGTTAFIFYRNATERRRLTILVEKQTEALKENEAHLIHAQKMGAIGEMVASVAHEVNTPLAAVKSSLQSSRDLISEVREHYEEAGKYVELAQQQPLEGARKAKLDAQYQVVSSLRSNIDDFDSFSTLDQLMEDGIRSVEHIYTVVVNMLNFSRLDRTKIAASKVEEGVDSTLAIANHVLKSVKIVKEYGDTKPVNCDMAQINQVVLNLVKNAAQAMPPEKTGGEIRIRTAMHSANEVRIDIADNGSGIPPDVLPKIWNPFFTTKAEGEGTGLGLSTCKKIITSHGGKITVASEVGKGTTFSVVLPVTPPESLYKEHGQQTGKQLVTA